MVEDSEGNVVGKRLPSFSYTGCWVHNITKFETEHVPAQIRRVQKEGSARRWVTGKRPAKKDDPELFEEDCLSRLKGVSEGKQKLMKTVGITKVKDLLSASAQSLKTVKGIGAKGLAKFQLLARVAKPGAYVSKVVDHRRATHPYKSRFPDTWKAELAADLKKESAICITELVEHMVRTTEEVMRGTKHEDDWYFYHDALTQLTDKRTKDWMVNKGYMKRWLLPISPCNAGTVYEGRPVGNTPEVMPWDCSLNQDVHVTVDNHSCYFRAIPKDHALYAKRFDKSSPSIMLKSYLRILDPVTGVCPSSKRIIQDITRCWGDHIDIICAHGGAAVDGIGSRNGHRDIKGLGSWGGKRVKKKEVREEALHPDALAAWDIYLRRSIDRHSHSTSSKDVQS